MLKHDRWYREDFITLINKIRTVLMLGPKISNISKTDVLHDR